MVYSLVTINYDRLLETFLYGAELLGASKPKENVSGERGQFQLQKKLIKQTF